MNLINTAVAILFVAVLLLPACAPQQQPPPTTPKPPAQQQQDLPPEMIEYTSPGQKIMVPVGMTFQITVNANPTTGYTWEAGFDQSLLKLVKRYTPSPSQTSMAGSGGLESLQFEGLKKGETRYT